MIVSDIDEAGARRVAEEIRATAVRADVTSAEDVQRLVDFAVREHGRVDLMFNNAGIGVGGEIRELTLEHWNRAIDVNLRGVVHGVAAAYPVMLRQGAGHIVNIASVAGLIPTPSLAPYGTTKAAVVALTAALRAESEAFGVRASAVCPGFIDTAIFDNAIGVKVDKTALLERLKLPLMPVDEAARAILRGVDRNEAVIVFPRSARALWRLARFAPGLTRAVQRATLKRMRRLAETRER